MLNLYRYVAAAVIEAMMPVHWHHVAGFGAYIYGLEFRRHPNCWGQSARGIALVEVAECALGWNMLKAER